MEGEMEGRRDGRRRDGRRREVVNRNASRSFLTTLISSCVDRELLIYSGKQCRVVLCVSACLRACVCVEVVDLDVAASAVGEMVYISRCDTWWYNGVLHADVSFIFPLGRKNTQVRRTSQWMHVFS